MTDREAPVDDRTTGESPHELLLALAGRIDDDLLAWCRELVAVGEDARALELITATLIADRTALPEPVRSALVGATRRARRDLDADAALAPAADVDETAHRFDTEPPGTQDLAAAVGALPTRQIAGCRSWVTMRTTPAGSAPGPLPQAVVLVEVAAGDTRPHDIMAYQLAIACARTGVPAAVEVVVAGADRPAYHEAALASAIPVHGADEPAAGEQAAGPEFPPAEFPRAPAAPVVDEPAVVAPVVVAPARAAAPELLSPGSPEPMLAAQNTGPVPVEAEPVTQSLPSSTPAPAPRPFPRRSARRGDDDAGAAFRAASAQSAPVSFESGRFASVPSVPEPSGSEPSEPSVPESSGSELPRSEHSEPRPHDEGLFDVDPSPGSGTSDDATGDRVPPDPGTPELPRRPRPVTALRGLTPAAPRPTPVRPSGVTPMPRPQPAPSPGRRGNLTPVAEPAVRTFPAPGGQSADTPAFASLGDPLDGPVEDRPTPLDRRGEPVIDENDPLGLGLMPVSAPEGPEPEPLPVSDSWLTDWITGDWAMSPSALDAPAAGDGPHEGDPLAATEPAATAVPPAGPRPRPEPVAEPDATRTGRRRAGGMRQPYPLPGEERADDHQPSPAVDPPAASRPPVAEPPTVEPSETSLEQTGFVLRPESVARLSDTDRELLARLQAELAETPRPRMTRRAGIAGSNGSATNGSATNGSAAPPDMAG